MQNVAIQRLPGTKVKLKYNMPDRITQNREYTYPELNKRYTIRSIRVWQNKIYITLTEIVNPVRKCADGIGEIDFDITFFNFL